MLFDGSCYEDSYILPQFNPRRGKLPEGIPILTEFMKEKNYWKNIYELLNLPGEEYWFKSDKNVEFICNIIKEYDKIIRKHIAIYYNYIDDKGEIIDQPIFHSFDLPRTIHANEYNTTIITIDDIIGHIKNGKLIFIDDLIFNTEYKSNDFTYDNEFIYHYYNMKTIPIPIQYCYFLPKEDVLTITILKYIIYDLKLVHSEPIFVNYALNQYSSERGRLAVNINRDKDLLNITVNISKLTITICSIDIKLSGEMEMTNYDPVQTLCFAKMNPRSAKYILHTVLHSGVTKSIVTEEIRDFDTIIEYYRLNKFFDDQKFIDNYIQLSKNLKLSPSTEFHTNTEKQIQIDYMNRQIKRRNEKREKLIDKIWNEIFIYQAKFEVKLPLEMWEHIFKFI